MHGIGETIVYSNQGVFTIESKCAQNIGGTTADYFLLRSCFDPRTVIYVPCDNERLLSRMRSILTKSEIDELISILPHQENIWITNERERGEKYRQILSSGDRLHILRLIRTLHGHKKLCATTGKKMHQADERFLREGEKLIGDEFSLVLGIDKKDIPEYITSKIN